MTQNSASLAMLYRLPFASPSVVTELEKRLSKQGEPGKLEDCFVITLRHHMDEETDDRPGG